MNMTFSVNLRLFRSLIDSYWSFEYLLEQHIYFVISCKFLLYLKKNTNGKKKPFGSNSPNYLMQKLKYLFSLSILQNLQYMENISFVEM